MSPRRGAALLGAVASLWGCTYYNTLHNAERLYQEGERHRVEGFLPAADLIPQLELGLAEHGEPGVRWSWLPVQKYDNCDTQT